MTSVERWVPVRGWEGFYEVSDLGRVRSTDRTLTYRNGAVRRQRGHILQPFDRGNGYHSVRLSRGDRPTNYSVHTLVLEAFEGPCPPGQEACHGPGGPLDNARTNLRWDTRLSNAADVRAAGTHRNSKKSACPLDHPLTDDNITEKSRVQGWRECLACSRAYSRVQSARRRGITLDFAAEAHAVHEWIRDHGPHVRMPRQRRVA